MVIAYPLKYLIQFIPEKEVRHTLPAVWKIWNRKANTVSSFWRMLVMSRKLISYYTLWI